MYAHALLLYTSAATVEDSELYRLLLKTKPKRQGEPDWNEGRNRTVAIPFKSYWAVTDTTDEIQTAEVRTFGWLGSARCWSTDSHRSTTKQDILGQDPLKAYGFRSMDKFGSKLAPPKWFKDDEVRGAMLARGLRSNDPSLTYTTIHIHK